MNVLEVEGLTKSYPSFTLKDVAFSVRCGEIMGFIGRNGAGKTTTLKSLLNMVHPDSGRIEFFSMPFASNEKEIKRRIGFVSGGVDFYTRCRIGTISRVASRFYESWDEEAYNRYMRTFALDERKTPAELSAGMKVKYNLTLALSHRAELLILDEPTSGLDPVSRDELLEIFLALRDGGTSILFSTHITSDLDKCADRITYISHGEIAASTELDTFVNSYSLVKLSEKPQGEAADAVIGVRRDRHGYTALFSASDAARLGLEAEKADLESIMVHMEKEDGDEGAAQ